MKRIDIRERLVSLLPFSLYWVLEQFDASDHYAVRAELDHLRQMGKAVVLEDNAGRTGESLGGFGMLDVWGKP